MLRQRMRWFFLESADSWYQMFGFLTFDPEPTVEALETRCAHLSQRLEAASAWHFFVFIRGLNMKHTACQACSADAVVSISAFPGRSVTWNLCATGS